MAEGKVIVSAENRVKQGLDDAKKDLTGFGDAAENIGKRLKEALSVTAIVVGFEKLGKAVFDCYQEFGEAERRLLRLKVALGDNESSVSKMERLIGDLKKQTLASKDEIENLVGELAMLGKSDTEIEKISRATVNLSNVTGQDLNSAFMLINGTFTGTAGRLERLIPQIGDLKKEQLEAGGAVDLINKKFGEMSAQLAENNIPQKIKNLQDSIGDLKEEIGKSIAPIITPIISEFTKFIDEKAIPKVKEIGTTLANIFRDIPGAAALAFEAVLDIIKTAFSWKTLGDIISNLGLYIAETIAAAFAVIPEIFIKLLDLLVNPLVSFGKFIGEVVAKAIQGKWKEIPSPGDLFADILQQQANTVGEIATTAGNLYMGQLKRVFYLDSSIAENIFGAPLGRFYKKFNDKFGPLPNGSVGGTDGGNGGSGDAGGNTGTTGSQASSYISDSWTRHYQALGEQFTSTLSQASDYVSDSWTRHYQKLGEIWQEEKNTLALMEKFAPTTSGPYSMSGWKMGYQLWQLQTENQYKDPLAGKWFARQFETAPEPLERTLGEKISDLGVKLYNWGNNNGGTVGNIASGAGVRLTGAGLGLDNIFGAIGGLVEKFWGLISSISSLEMILDPVTTILQAALQVIQPMLDTILTPIVGILQILGQTIGQMLLPFLQALAPVVKFIGDAFVWLYNNVIAPVGNLIYKTFATIWNAIASALNSLLGWLGVHLGTIDTSVSVLQKIDAGALQTAGASAVGQTAAQSANYRSQSITINIYQEAPVVGSGGMTEFARIIRGEFERLGYYGA